MASCIRCKFSTSTASFALMIAFLYCGTAMPTRMPTMAITVMSSMSVNPDCPRSERLATVRRSPRSTAPMGVSGLGIILLPFVVLRLPVERRRVALREDVPDVLAAPRRVRRLLRVAAHPPLRRVRHGVDRDLAQD